MQAIEFSKKLQCRNPECGFQPIFKDRKPSETGVYDRSLPYIIKKDKQIDSFMSVDIKRKLEIIREQDAHT